MTSNNYWQSFPTTIVNNDNGLVSQSNTHQVTSEQQPSWNDQTDKRKWSQDVNDFNMNTTSEDYSNSNFNDPIEADSPDSGSGSGRRQDSITDLNMLSGDQKQRRKEQNRAAQRAFRERKEKFVKELQQKIKEMEKKHNTEMTRVTRENESLRQQVKQMEAEIYTLKGAAMAFNVSINKLREAGIDVQQAHPSPPPSEKQSPGIMAHPDMTPSHDGRPDHFSKSRAYPEDLQDEEASFAEPEVQRFEHKIHPLVTSGMKMIPCHEIWERLSQHPNFDEFDQQKLCQELKDKAICSGHGPVIPESELLAVLQRMDSRTN